MIASPFVFIEFQKAAEEQKLKRENERKEAQDILNVLNFVVPSTWTLTQVKKETSSDDQVWCGGRIGTLMEFEADSSVPNVVTSLDRAIGKGVDPYEGIESGIDNETRIYAGKEGFELHLYAVPVGEQSKLYLCNVADEG